MARVRVERSNTDWRIREGGCRNAGSIDGARLVATDVRRATLAGDRAGETALGDVGVSSVLDRVTASGVGGSALRAFRLTGRRGGLVGFTVDLALTGLAGGKVKMAEVGLGSGTESSNPFTSSPAGSSIGLDQVSVGGLFGVLRLDGGVSGRATGKVAAEASGGVVEPRCDNGGDGGPGKVCCAGCDTQEARRGGQRYARGASQIRRTLACFAAYSNQLSRGSLVEEAMLSLRRGVV